mmetsp:Transcript_4465/g.8837  ORF Transcript_4465/g.8837 Transcript_4465/m.8837 type:complete len:373 (-) Transcript_4465:1973-3091(-)
MELEVTRRVRPLRVDNARQDHFYLHFTRGSTVFGENNAAVCQDPCWVPLILPGEQVHLLPGEALPLMIFSELMRHRILQCMNTDESGMRAMVAVFGKETGGTHKLSRVGCLAEIVNFACDETSGVDRLLVFGRQRVTLIEAADDHESGLVRFFDDTLTTLPREIAQGRSGLPQNVCLEYDSHCTAQILIHYLEEMSGQFLSLATQDSVQISFDFCSWVPVSPQYREEVLQSTSLASRLLSHVHFMKRFRSICCKFCNHVLVESKADILPSPATYFVNPYGSVHGIVKARLVDGAVDDDPPNPELSWMKGYAWQIVLCKRCYAHIGWKFSAWESIDSVRMASHQADSNGHPSFFALRTSAVHCSMAESDDTID